MFPLTADDMIKGVAFCDFGTVERDIEFNSDNFRVSPGIGVRINIPALGPAPLAFDLAAPIIHADGDNLQNFSFFFGFGR
jgi:outer membrane protein insertion porin family